MLHCCSKGGGGVTIKTFINHLYKKKTTLWNLDCFILDRESCGGGGIPTIRNHSSQSNNCDNMTVLFATIYLISNNSRFGYLVINAFYTFSMLHLSTNSMQNHILFSNHFK